MSLLLVGVLAAPAPAAPRRIDLKDAPGLKVRGAYRIQAAGDVNSDGAQDVMVLRGDGQSRWLEIIFGPLGVDGTIDLAQESHRGFRVFVPNGVLHFARAGDVNGDSRQDILIGVRDPMIFQSGRAYLVFGKTDGGSVDLAAFDDGTQQTQGFKIAGSGSIEGSHLAMLGDLNGDGLDDFMVTTDFAVRVFVIFGKSDPNPVDVRDLFEDPNPYGYVIFHPRATDYWAGAPAGDFNDDGLTDVVVGLHRRRHHPGGAWVVFGKPDARPVSLSGVGEDGVRIRGNYGETGTRVTGIGDFDGDGCDDVVVGAPKRLDHYIVYGCHGWRSISLSSLGRHGATVETPGGIVWGILGGGSDINGDGRSDFAIGEPAANPYRRRQAGSVYVVLGGKDFDKLRAWKNGRRAIRIDGAEPCPHDLPRYADCPGDSLGGLIDLTSDLDGDGRGDLLASARDPSTDEGRSYVVGSTLLFP